MSDYTSILNKYRHNIFEIQTNGNNFGLYTLKTIDFVQHDQTYSFDQIYFIFESIDKDQYEILAEINLGVDLMISYNNEIKHFTKTIRVECSEENLEFSENACIILKNILNNILNLDQNLFNENSKASIKTIEPYYFNNIRSLN